MSGDQCFYTNIDRVAQLLDSLDTVERRFQELDAVRLDDAEVSKFPSPSQYLSGLLGSWRSVFAIAFVTYEEYHYGEALQITFADGLHHTILLAVSQIAHGYAPGS